jgi:hypothetical protein
LRGALAVAPTQLKDIPKRNGTTRVRRTPIRKPKA